MNQKNSSANPEELNRVDQSEISAEDEPDFDVEAPNFIVSTESFDPIKTPTKENGSD